MKLNYLIKSIPFLSTLIIIIFLHINNQKVNTRLRILVWNTPTHSLGSYLAISTGAGFILSYILTTNIANINKLKSQRSLNYKLDDNNESTYEYSDSNIEYSSDKTLIERDFSDPLPTINAQFRVIGKTERSDNNYMNNKIKYNKSNEFEKPYIDQYDENENINEVKDILSDWDDDSFASW